MPSSRRRCSTPAQWQREIRPDVHRVRDGFDDLIASAFCVSVAALHGRSRGTKQVALARQAAMYLAHVRAGLTLTEAGALYGRDRTTAAYACRVIEECRDDAALDFILTTVEGECDGANARVNACAAS